MSEKMTEKPEGGAHFIHTEIEKDIEAGTYGGKVLTRFPPEPNGYLHIGHAKAICINFGTALKYGGKCNLRFDDTNPVKEETEYVDSIMDDIHWLGFDWEDRLFYASDYFGRLYGFAEKLIQKGLAYVCDLSADEIKEYRGTLTETGKDSPYRDRPVEKNLDLFRRMRAGEFPDGARVLRAKIDMNSPNLNMRDPVIYRIAHTSHHRTGDAWCIYPMYDFQHPLSDAFEGVTHSLCSLEFEDHRPLYNWFVEKLAEEFPYLPKQREFARLELTNTVTSKRKLRALVEDHTVSGWDDPRMPTLRALRRKGYSPAAIRTFIEEVGVAKRGSRVDIAFLEYCVREDLKMTRPRMMAVIDPVKLVIDNYPADKVEWLPVQNNQENPDMGERTVPFSREIWIEREDFMENPPKKYFRLYPDKEVRLKGAYCVTCVGVDKDADGNITEIHCTYDPATLSGQPMERKVKGTLHWVSAAHAVPTEMRLYDYLFLEDEAGEMTMNPDSLTVTQGYAEPALIEAKPEDTFQFLRQGYFCMDRDSTPEKLVFNRTVPLKSSFTLPTD
jgi:glutaminyl-tRNA synthetase